MGVLLNFTDCLQHVQQAFAVVSHNSTASASTRLRMRC